MRSKTKKLIWLAPIAAVIAAIGALAIFAAQPAEETQAHDLAAPGIVTGVKATAQGRDTIVLSWNAPSGGAPDYYRIDRSLPDDSDNWMRLVEMHTDSSLSYTDKMKLKVNKTYHYRIFAVNVAGTGPSSDLTANSMATTDDASQPGPVEMLAAEVVGPNQIDVSWNPPLDGGGASITRYCIVTVVGTGNLPDLGTCAGNTSPTSASDIATITTTDAGGTIVIRAPQADGKVTFMHKKLPASTARKYEVYAVNSKGVSTAATAVAPVPKTKAPSAPGAPTLHVVANALNDVDLYWTWPINNGGANITTFDIRTKVESGSWTITGANNNQIAGGTTGTEPQATDRSITETTSFQVRAFNGTADGSWSNTVTVKVKSGALAVTAPAPVSGQTSTADTGLRQVDLKWTDVENTSYLIDFRKGTGNWTALQSSTGYSDATYNHKGLDPDTDNDNTNDYSYRLFSYANGAAGVPVGVTSSTSQATTPPGVRGLKTSSDDPTKIKVEWSKPTTDGGQPITGYRIEIGLDDDFPNTDHQNGQSPTHMSEKCPTIPTTADGRAGYICTREVEGAGATTYTLGDLGAGTARWFRVFAINKVAEDDNAFPGDVDERKAYGIKGVSAQSGKPGMPLDPTAQAARDANIKDPTKLGIDILWNSPGDPAGDSVTGYVIARRTKDSSTAAWSAWDDDWATVDGSGFLRTSHTDIDEPDNLANGEMRQYRVAAMSGTGMGAYTGVVTYPAPTGEHSHVMASGTIDAKTVIIGATESVNAASYFTGATGYSVTSSMPSYATATVDNMGMVTITAVAAGASTVKVTATDMFMGTATQDIMVTVTAANTAPTAKDIGAQTLAVGGSIELDLSKYFTDADNDQLTYTHDTANDAGAITISRDGSMVTITGEKMATATITVTATDAGGSNNTVSQTFTVTVVNQEPKAGAAIPDVSLEMGGTKMVESTITDADAADAGKLTWDWSSDDEDAATVMADATDMSKATVTGVAIGSAEITVTATDSQKATATQTFTVMVGNTAPMAVGSLDAQTLTAGEMSSGINVAGAFSDADGHTLTYTATSSNEDAATASVSGSVVTISAVAAGTATVTVTADDGHKGTATQDIMVTVVRVNAAPMPAGTIGAQTVTEGMALDAMDVTEYFSDADEGETLTYAAASDMETVATVAIDGSEVTISGVAAGSATITVTATDSFMASAKQTIMVTVAAANDAPTAVGSIAAVTLMAGDSSDAMDVSGNFSDADGDDLTYSVMSSDETVATVVIEGSMVTITGVGAGTATVTVTAADGIGGTATQPISVTVAAALTQPTNLRINPVGNGIMHVEWDAVAGAAGFYVIAVAPGNATDYGTAVVNNATATEAAIDGLTPGNDYNVVVVAFGGGKSQVSAIKTLTAR